MRSFKVVFPEDHLKDFPSVKGFQNRIGEWVKDEGECIELRFNPAIEFYETIRTNWSVFKSYLVEVTKIELEDVL